MYTIIIILRNKTVIYKKKIKAFTTIFNYYIVIFYMYLFNQI